jgi:hypothetical protein
MRLFDQPNHPFNACISGPMRLFDRSNGLFGAYVSGGFRGTFLSFFPHNKDESRVSPLIRAGRKIRFITATSTCLK